MDSVAIIGGGAAGFFLAVCLKEAAPDMDVTIFESGHRVLRKVKVSGGGRCNITNTFDGVSDLAAVYPRGHRLMKRLLKGFSQRDAIRWWERHGVQLVAQADGCVFPRSQDSQEVIDCLVGNARRLGVRLVTGHRIAALDELEDFLHVCVATGGLSLQGKRLLEPHVAIEQPVPSLFSLSVDDGSLRALAGIVVEVNVRLAGTPFVASGPLLVTHWGVSGPVVLKLSSYAARHLHQNGYTGTISVGWLQMNDEEVRRVLDGMSVSQPRRRVLNTHPQQLPSRLWEHIVARACVRDCTWAELSKKDRNRLVATLASDVYPIAGRAAFHDEFVTCGGVSLAAINPVTLASRTSPTLHFVGEALDIDGITGGFNFQCAWTTAYTVAQAIVAHKTF